MQILVTGGAGFIGSAIVRAALNAGHTVLNYDVLTAAASLADVWDLEEDPSYSLVSADICDRQTLDAVLEAFRPETIFHCAAETLFAWPLDGEKRSVHTNVTGTVTLLDAAHSFWSRNKTLETARFVNLMASASSGVQLPDLAKETLGVRENLITTWAASFAVPSIKVTVDQVFGVKQRFGNPLKYLLEADHMSDDLGADGKDQNWIDVHQVAQGMLWAATQLPRDTPYAIASNLWVNPADILTTCEPNDSIQMKKPKFEADWVSQEDTHKFLVEAVTLTRAEERDQTQKIVQTEQFGAIA